MAGERVWEKGPWALLSLTRNGAKDPQQGVQHMITDMIIIHNIAIRAVNAIYLQCLNVGTSGSPKDQSDFLEYCAVWVVFIHGHHDEEEEYVFPDIEKLAGVPGLMGANVEQHRAFHDGLDTFTKYVNDAKAGKEKYDGQKIRDIIDSFMPALYKHLNQEIPTLSDLKKFDKVDWKKYWDEKSAEIIKKQQADPDSAPIILPFALTGQDNTFEEGMVQWPPIPWVLKLMFRWFFIPKHSDWWRFAPCDSSSQPKDLPFASA